MTLWTTSFLPEVPAAFGPNPELLFRLTHDLTPEQAQHVAILTPEGITANSAQLHGALRFHRFDPSTGEALLATGSGGLISLVKNIVQSLQAKNKAQQGITVICKDENSGPYRRVYSKAGFAYQYSKIFLPSDVSGTMKILNDSGHGDTAFVYMGGWGGKGGAVDAGFQHGRYMNGVQDDWSPFFLVQQMGGPSAITLTDQKQADGAPWRLLAGQEVELSFWVTKEADLTILSMTMKGITNLDRQPATLTLRAPIDYRFGWDALGGANILKRMTTIGQTRGNQNLATGSYMAGVNWNSSTIGLTATNAQPWQSKHTGGYCTFPDPKTLQGQQTGNTASKWQIVYKDAASETANIYLK